MTQTPQAATQEALLYAEFGERSSTAVVEQPLTLLERHELHNIVTRHHGAMLESISRRLVVTFSRPSDALACARDLRSNVQQIRSRSPRRIGLYCRMLLLPAPPGTRDNARWAETALKLSLHLNNSPLNGIVAVDDFLKLLPSRPLPAPRALPSAAGRIALHLLAYEDGENTQEGLTRRASPLASAGIGVFSDLVLKVGEQMRVVHPPECPISVGRSKTCGLVLQGDEVSRVHGRIEFEKEKFFYVDESRNGTYVLTQDGTEVNVVNERIMLVGDGVISPGVPMMKQTGQVIRFRCSPVSLSLGDDVATKPRD
jgi:hypothetical protein